MGDENSDGLVSVHFFVKRTKFEGGRQVWDCLAPRTFKHILPDVFFLRFYDFLS
jgi:hypothetical protein